MKWWVITRNEEPMIIPVGEGKDPLAWRQGWPLTGGPLNTAVDAENFVWGDEDESKFGDNQKSYS